MTSSTTRELPTFRSETDAKLFRLRNFAVRQCRQEIYKLQSIFSWIINVANSIYSYILRLGWPVFAHFARFEHDNKRITQDGTDSKQDSRVVQGKFAFSRQFHSGVSRDT